MGRSAWFVGILVAGLVAVVAVSRGPLKSVVGPQPDGSFIVSTGQRLVAGSLPFPQRLSDLAVHPDGRTVAVVGKNQVFVVKGETISPGVPIGASAGFHGVAWTPDGKRLLLSTNTGSLCVMDYSESGELTAKRLISLERPGFKKNPVPGGLAVARDGKRAYVACANLGAVVEVDLVMEARVKEWPAQMLPFSVALTSDESGLVVSNWAGQPPKPGEMTDLSEDLEVAVTQQGSTASGSVSLIDLKGGATRTVKVGLHPTGVAVLGGTAYVTNSQSDTVSEIDIAKGRVKRTIELKFQGKKVLGSMPNELVATQQRLWLCNGGDNALCEVDRASGKVVAYRPAGFFPTAVGLAENGAVAYVLNTKGNGSVMKTLAGSNKRNTHDFQGSVTRIDLRADPRVETEKVATLNAWNEPKSAYKPNLKVYRGAIKHVIHVIKENRTYDEIFGDMPEGDGDASLCSLGETVMPNHRKIAREFGLFDNAYTCGTNSADGHQWCDQAMANEYLEHFYVGYSRTYPDDGEDAMALNASGRIWDAALKAGKTARVYGEWAGDDQAVYEPRKPKDWFEAWDDRVSGRNVFRYKAHTRVRSLQPILCPDYHYWPLIQSDQSRIDVFEREFKQFVKNGDLPNLLVMSLPSDHSEGMDPNYPTPRSMMADNDLALGRLLEIVSHSPYWKDTCIFVTQDDSQGGPDHVDGHRSVCLVASPYSRRRATNSQMTNQLRTLRTIEEMLGIKPMTKFDTIARPLSECFTDVPDLTPYTAAKNNVPLGERNPARSQLSAEGKKWYDVSASLDWSGMDRADFYWLNRIVWHTLHKTGPDYPGRPGEEPGQIDRD